MRHPVSKPRRATAVPGRVRAMGGVGGHIGAPPADRAARAAEPAAPAAKRIFWDAIGEMTIDDGRRILNGSETAATDYFKDKTTSELTAAFSPIVHRTMGEVGVTRQYQDLFGRAQSIPFLSLEAFDLDRYVVGRALDGLFPV